MLFHWPCSIVLLFMIVLPKMIMMLPSATPLKPKPALQWIHVHTRQIQWCCPFHVIVSCCVLLGLAKLVLDCRMWLMACTTVRPTVYHTPNLIFLPWLIVVSIVTCNPEMIHRPLSMHFLYKFYLQTCLFIVVFFVEVSSNIQREDDSFFMNQNIMKIIGCSW